MFNTINFANAVSELRNSLCEELIFPRLNDIGSSSSALVASVSSSPLRALRPLSVEQESTGKKIINYFVENIIHRWAILQAQMQSGKTETYLFVAAEMLRMGLVKHFIIFSGNAEIALKNQVIDILTDSFSEETYTEEERLQKSFMRKYEDYLIDTLHLNTRQILDILRTFKDKSKKAVIWGSDLSKYSGSVTDTLLIWEESHFAQDQDNLPAKFLQRIGISADGDASLLQSNRNYVLSVSATGFSELSDNHYQIQGKLVQTLKPGAGYNSVEKMMSSGRIKPYKTIQEGLTQALSTEHVGEKYAVVRVTIKNEQSVAEICRNQGWRVVSHDSTTKSDEGARTWNNMKNAPLMNTVILLKEMCRMGQNIEKTHVLFCFETSKNSKTDTMLQSFVGRVCGYSTNSENVDVYLPEKTFNNGEIERYIRMTKGEAIAPLKARNLAPLAEKNPESGRFPIIPVLFKKSALSPSEHRAGLSIKDKERVMIQDMRAALNAGQFENLNQQDTLLKIKRLMNDDAVQLKIRNLWDKTNKRIYESHEIVDKNINESWGRVKDANGQWSENSVNTPSPPPLNVIHGVGKNPDGLKVNAWFTKQGDVYLECLVENEERAREIEDGSKIARTTLREVFCHRLEDGTEQVTNGAFSIHLTPMSSHFVDNMRNELSEIVKISLALTDAKNTRKISSVKDCTHKGISLTPRVFDEMKPGGCIYNYIESAFGVKLKMSKSKAAPTNEHNALGLIRIASISW